MGLNNDAINEHNKVLREKRLASERNEAIRLKNNDDFKNRMIQNLKDNAPAAKGVSVFQASEFSYKRQDIELGWDCPTVTLQGYCGDISWENDGHKFSASISHMSYPDRDLPDIYIRIAADPEDPKASTFFRAKTLNEIGLALKEGKRRQHIARKKK